MVRRVLLAAWLALVVPASCRATELTAAQVAIIAARGNAQSEELARYYAAARAIPAANICLVDLPAGEACSRDQWESAIRPAIRAWLAEHDPDRRVQCLVTVWGVPLRIEQAAPGPKLRKYGAYLAGQHRRTIESLEAAVAALNALAPVGAITTDSVGARGPGAAPVAVDGPPGGATPQPGGTAEGAMPSGDPAAGARPAFAQDPAQRQRFIERALRAAQERISQLAPGAMRQNAEVQIQQLVALAGGASVILGNVEQQAAMREASPEIRAEAERLRGALAAWAEARELLERDPPSIARDAMLLGLVERTGGLLGGAAWLEERLQIAEKNESAASFDSELALVLWDDYQLLRWQPNYLSSTYDGSYLRQSFPTLMTARIDGPTIEAARGIVDAARDAEQTGLAGKAYFDGRGLATLTGPPPQYAPAQFDRAILAAGAGIDAQTDMEVIVNAEPALFAAGECPDAAVYCGWYSLGRYVDAFRWSRGAVAYHAGGPEASGLHDPASQRWCPRMLAAGVAATIGAVDEPYVVAYPRPDEFFGLLLRGEATLAECYWKTQPATSWSMLLIGDPLYRPFKNRPLLREEGVLR